MQGSGREPLGLAHPGRVFLATSITILLADQVTKAIVRAQLPVGSSVPFVPGFIRLTSVRNTGAAFGIFPGRQQIFVFTSLLVLFAIAAFWRRMKPAAWPVVIALAMVTAGALGNLIDRAFVGRVTDFLEFAFVDFPVFNVADMGIVGGVGVLMLWILFGPQPISPAIAGDDAGDQCAADAEEAARANAETSQGEGDSER